MEDRQQKRLKLLIKEPNYMKNTCKFVRAEFVVSSFSSYLYQMSGLIQGLRQANERRRYFVTTSLIDWVQA